MPKPDRYGPSVYSLADWDHGQLRRLAKEYGTPLYVYDLDRLEQNYRRLRSSFETWTVKYAAKANSNAAVVTVLNELDAEMVCASPFELRRLSDLGVPVGNLQYTAVHASDEYVEMVCELETSDGAPMVTIGSIDTLLKFIEGGYSGEAFLRVNSNYLTDSDTLTPQNAKFGMQPDRISRALDLLNGSPITFAGIHVHTGDMNSRERMNVFYTVLRNTARLVSEIQEPVNRLNIGGGLRVPFTQHDTSVKLADVKRTVEQILSEYDGKIVIEPGKYIASDIGTTLTTVTSVKQTPATTVVGVDLAAHSFPRPGIWHESHRIHNLTSPGALERTQTVSGPSCTWYTGYIGLERSFPESSTDDLLAVNKTGAYSHSMASLFHLIPRPPIVAIRHGEEMLIRERDSLDTVVGPEINTNFT